MPSKKNKGDQKKDDASKPLSFYVKDRLELTKQLFSCLKRKQVKSRLPKNLSHIESIERIQQICLDEILGISSKRLLSIINSTNCPADTESDSDIEKISLSEISSDEIEISYSKPKDTKPQEPVQTKKNAEKNEKQPKRTEKEMTMLELLELQMRARAIRSQLALEPITKIELDSSDNDEPVVNSKSDKAEKQKSPKAAANDKNDTSKETQKSKISLNQEKEKDVKNTASTSKSVSFMEKPKETKKKSQKPSSNNKEKEKSPEIVRKRRIVVLKSPDRNSASNKKLHEPPKQKEEQQQQQPHTSKSNAAPIKLKRNYASTSISSKNVLKEKSPSPPKNKEGEMEKEIDEKELNESRNSSPDVITMEQNIATYFISDSDDDEKEPPSKKQASPKNKIIVTSVEVIAPAPTIQEKPEEDKMEDGQILEPENTEDDKKSFTDGEKNQIDENINDDDNKTEEDDDENVVNIMSDTEIDMNGNSDKEKSQDGKKENKQNEKETDKKIAEETVKENTKESSEEEKKAETPNIANEQQQSSVQSDYGDDDDVVEILNSDDDMLDKPTDSAKTSDESETWEQRYLRSSNVTSILKSSQFSTKVRGKIAQNMKMQSISKKRSEKEKEVKEKISTLEEGSIEQFNVLKKN